MSTSCKLIQVSKVEKESLFKQYGISEEQFEENINHLLEWVNKTSLPMEETRVQKFRTFLCNCKMSLERTKRAIEGYYKIRTVYSSYFDIMLPTTDEYKRSKYHMEIAVMPKLTPDLCRMFIAKVADDGLEDIDGLLYFMKGIMMLDIVMMSGYYYNSNILIFDGQHVQFRHIIKMTFPVLQKLANILVAIKLRIKHIHFVNSPPVVAQLMPLLKAVLPAKIMSKVCVHTSFEALYEYIPKEYLPSEYNGNQPSINQISEEWLEEIERREDYFQKMLEVKAKDYINLAVEEREVFGLGVDGSFKKLLID